MYVIVRIIMRVYVNIHMLRPGVRYTFTLRHGVYFRAIFDAYVAVHDVPRCAIRLSQIDDGGDGYIFMTISNIRFVSVYVLPNYITHFRPDIIANMNINQFL
jgi:hypothetical protein